MEIDVIDFWEKQVQQWNDDKLCGDCWFFAAPLIADEANEQQAPEGKECCVNVFVTNYREVRGFQRSRTTGLVNKTPVTYSFDLNVVKRDDIGRNVYNEIKGYAVEDSKWKKIMNPLRKCVTPKVLDFCTHVGAEADVTNWTLQPRLNWLDDNYTGWTIHISFTIADAL